MALRLPAFAAAFTCALAGFLLVGRPNPPGAPAPRPVAAVDGSPLAFAPVGGAYAARGPGYSVRVTGSGADVAVRSAVLRSRLVGARVATPAPERPLPGKVNFLVGPRETWRTEVSTYAAVRHTRAWPGIDVRYRGTEGRLEYDLLLSGGADPAQIAIALEGARSVRIDAHGDLLVGMPGGVLRQHAPIGIQDGRRVPVAYELEDRTVRFRIGRYDRSRPLMIDPVVSFSSYLGGNGAEEATGIAVDSSGNVIVGGSTQSTDLGSPGAYDTSRTGTDDFFVTKLAPGGSSILWTTYLGGSSSELDAAIGVDSGGNVYVSGTTASTDIPLAGAAPGGQNGFVAKLGANGSSLAWAKYVSSSGSNNDSVNTIAVDAAGNSAVAGSTPTTIGSTFGTVAGSSNAFAQRFDTSGNSLGAYTIGGDGAEAAYAVGLNGSTVWLGGQTSWINTTNYFPTTTGAVQTSASNSAYYSYNGFLASATISAGTATTACSTLFGGGNVNVQDEFVSDLAVGSDGNVHVAASSSDTSFPGVTIAGTHGSSRDGLYARFNGCSSVTQARWIGGNGFDDALGVAVDSAHNATVVGTGDALSSPLDQTQPHAGAQDGLVAKVKGGTSNLVYATNFGSAGGDALGDVALDSAGHAWIAGRTTTGLPLVNPLVGDTPSTDALVAEFQPAPAGVTGADGPTNDTTPTFNVSNNNTGGTVTCQLEGVDPSQTTCGSTRNYSLGEGTYTFRAKAKDAGNTTAADTVRTITVDVTAPAAFALREPANGAQAPLAPTLSWDRSSDARSGVAAYDVLVDDAKVAELAAAACADGCTATIPPQVEGRHTWKVRARDAAGNATESESREIVLGVPPTAALTIAPNPVLAGRPANFDGSASADEGSGIALYEWDLDGDGSFETKTGTVAVATKSYSGPGDVPVSLRVTDAAGLTGTVKQTLRVSAAPGTAAQPGVSINKGAQYTNSPEVKLALVPPAVATSVLVSNDGGFASPTTFLLAPEIPWKLDSSGPERLPKTVYARYLPSITAGLTFTDDIILDERPPVVSEAAIAPAPAAASAAVKRPYRLRVKAADTNSGVAGVQATANKRKPGRLLRYRRRMTVRATAPPRFLRAKDRAGNYSRWKKLR